MDSELFKPFKLCFAILKFYGMWQDGNQSWIYFAFGYLAHIIGIQVYMMFQFVFAILSENLLDFTEAVTLAITNLAMVFKCFNFFMKIKNIIKSLEVLKTLLELSVPKDENNKRDLLRSRVNFGYKIFKIFWSTVILTCVVSTIPPFVSHQLPYKIWFPFDTKNSEFGFWAAFAIMSVNSPYVAFVDCALDILPVIFITFAIGLIDELSARIELFGLSDDIESSKIELKKCIEIHKSIKSYIAMIQDNFAIATLLQGLLSTVIMCTSAFTMSTVSCFFFLTYNLTSEC